MALEAQSPFRDERSQFAAGRMGMWIFLVSLGMVFAAVVVAYIVVRLQLVSEDDWKPEDTPGLGWLLVLSTVLLVGASGTLWGGTRAARSGGTGRTVGGWMAATSLLIVGFLVSQTFAWIDLWRANLVFDESLYAWTFYVLTGLHALHVIGGLGPLALTTRNAFLGRYGKEPTSRAGLLYCGMYWHFLDAVWLILYVVLLWGTRPA